MKLPAAYLDAVTAQLRQIADTQMPAIERAAEWFAAALLAERWIYLFGTGHSHMLAEELFYRAGGLARIVPMLYPPLMLHQSASDSTRVERNPETVARLLEIYPLAAGDVLLVASNSGRNVVPVELAMRVRDRGVKTIALVNREHGAAFPSRHPSGKRLAESVDLCIDNRGVAGDACVDLDVPGPGSDCPRRIGAASTVTGAAILQMIACGAVEIAVRNGWNPELFASSNAGGHDQSRNDRLLEKFGGIVPHL